jgi:hypothetical protein
VPDTGTPTTDRGLLLLSAVVGMAAIVSLPLLSLIVSASAGAPLLFSVPLLLALTGKRRGQPRLVVAAGVVLVLLAAALLLQNDLLGLLAFLVVLTGPVLAILLVGVPLRDTDLVAAAAFMLGGTIAVVSGFTIAGVSRPGAGIVVGLVAVASLAVVAVRLRRAT